VATVTKPLATIFTDFGDVTMILEYDNTLLRATAVICSNPTPQPARFDITRDSDGRNISHTTPPNTIGERTNIPTGVAGRIDLVFNSRGGLNGYSFGATWPA